MDKNKKRCKLSYFKKLLMFRELQQQGTLENFPPPECQRAFLNALSVKEFSKVYRNLNRFEAAAFEVLYLIALSGSCSFREDQKVSSVLHVIADIYDHLQ